MAGYDRETGEVLFVKTDGEVYRYPLSELDSLGRWRIVIGVFEEGGSGASFVASALVVLVAVALGFFAILLLLQWVAYGSAARLLTGIPGFSIHFRALLKLLLVGIVGGGVFLAIASMIALGSGEGFPALDDPGASPAIHNTHLFVSLAIYVAGVLVLRSHYGIGAWRAIAVRLLADVFAMVLVGIFVGAIALAIIFGSTVDWGTREMRLIEWLLRLRG